MGDIPIPFLKLPIANGDRFHILHDALGYRFGRNITNSRSPSRSEFGERGRNRTYNLVIKSHLLCQLSYAPVPVGSTNGECRHPQYNIAQACFSAAILSRDNSAPPA